MNSMFEFGHRRAHLGSNNNRRSNAANHDECFFRRLRFSTHDEIRGYRCCASRVTDLAVNIDDTVARVIRDELTHFHKLRLRGSSQVQHGNISIIDFAEWFRLGKFSAQIEHGDNAGTHSLRRRTGPEFAADPDLWCDLVPRSALASII